jgi:hypothetical protein
MEKPVVSDAGPEVPGLQGRPLRMPVLPSWPPLRTAAIRFAYDQHPQRPVAGNLADNAA